MTRHRTITLSAGALAALCLVGSAAAAQATPLLSGYGGPGQGNQAILGAALLNGPTGGGSSGGGSSGGGSLGESGSAPTPKSVGAARGGLSGGSNPSAVNVQPGAPVGSSQRAAQTPRDATSAYLAAERGHAVRRSGALGLTGQDVLYIILALGVLTLAAVFTRRLTQTTAAGTQR